MKLTAILVENKEIKKIQKIKSIVSHILEQVRDVDINKMKLDPQFIMFICEIIENQVKKDKQIDKMIIFVEVMSELKLDEHQIEEAKKIVEFLLENQMIKKTKLKKIIWHCIKSFFFKQVSM